MPHEGPHHLARGEGDANFVSRTPINVDDPAGTGERMPHEAPHHLAAKAAQPPPRSRRPTSTIPLPRRAHTPRRPPTSARRCQLRLTQAHQCRRSRRHRRAHAPRSSPPSRPPQRRRNPHLDPDAHQRRRFRCPGERMPHEAPHHLARGKGDATTSIPTHFNVDDFAAPASACPTKLPPARPPQRRRKPHIDPDARHRRRRSRSPGERMPHPPSRPRQRRCDSHLNPDNDQPELRQAPASPSRHPHPRAAPDTPPQSPPRPSRQTSPTKPPTRSPRRSAPNSHLHRSPAPSAPPTPATSRSTPRRATPPRPSAHLVPTPPEPAAARAARLL